MLAMTLAIAIPFIAYTVQMLRAGDLHDAEVANQSGDYTTALKISKLLAEKGCAEAQTGLEVMYAKGEGVLQDDREAVRWYRLAAEQGDA